MNFTNTNSSLNSKQYKAVTLKIDTNSLILAGAGSGKTKILIHRIEYLCANYMVDTNKILAVTFTNKAAKEMKHRLQLLLTKPVDTMWIGTFHGIAYRMLQDNFIGIKYQIIDSQDQLRIIKDIVKTMSLDEKNFIPQKIRSFINSQKDEGNRHNNISVGENFFVKRSVEVYQKYQKYCDDNNLLDFAEILLKNYELLENNTDIRDKYQKQFSHILIDEFQDTNSIQYKWIKLLNNNNTLFFVGDDDQSIYGWRGAKIENILNVKEDFAPIEMIRLEQNYRSTGNILAAANALIKNNKQRLGKLLWTDSGDGELIEIIQTSSDKQEINAIVGKISQYITDNITAGECAVLYRTNAQSRLVEEQLIAKQIPYEIYGGLRFFERAEIKHIISYLKLALNYNNDVAFDRIINIPPRGIGDSSYDKLTVYAKGHGLSYWDAINKIDLLSARAKNALLAFQQLIIDIADSIANTDLENTLITTIKKSTLIEHYSKSNNEINKSKIQNLEELIGAGKDYQIEHRDDYDDKELLDTFIDSSMLDTTNLQQESIPKVQLMTIHSAKGLEFGYVFIVGLEEGIFPSSQSQGDELLISEERRLCYVAMTRAIKKLHLSFCQKRFLWGNIKELPPSRFLSELPSKNISFIKIGLDSKSSQKEQNFTNKTPQINSKNSDYKIGDLVKHQKFGTGSVVNYSGTGKSTRIEVNFKHYGSKWLMLEYAKIVKLR